ncbi:MAG TPA: RtcB family protein, partial [Candidatus Angelobacter sp.]|nr:RtcB family protein [Candidatus Angelobacter sp.]
MSTQALNSRSRSSADIPIKQISENIWEVPQDYQPGMKVPARIYADEDLLAKMRTDRTIQQCVNVTHLNGIYKYAITMPDGHEGYGFPIGGVAATDYDEGLISPGGVGYDINCISGSSLVLDEHSCRRRILDFAYSWPGSRIRCVDGKKAPRTEIVHFLSRHARNILRIRTLLGNELLATKDHPFLTQHGMVPLGEVRKGKNKVAVYPFAGVEYEEPNEFPLVTRKDIIGLLLPANRDLLCKELKKRGFIPLNSTNAKLPLLLKIMGFIIGDGSLTFTPKTHRAWFYGKREDLDEIRQDVKRLGFKPSKIYSRTRLSKIRTKYSDYSFNHVECCFGVRSRSLIALLVAMGSPLGSKAAKAFLLPEWLFGLPKWQKRLFLASLFGADLSSPKTMTGHGHNFYTPVLGQNKKAAFADSGVKLLGQVAALLQDLGIKAKVTSIEKNNYVGVNGSSTRIRLLVSSESANLIRFWSTIGFEYNRQKSYLANAAVHYLKLKRKILEEKASSAMIAIVQETSGGGATEKVPSPDTRESGVGVHAQDPEMPSIAGFRIGREFPEFNEFLKLATEGLGRSGAVWDEIASVEEIPFNDDVYDLTVASDAHNFIANGFVVSNCGVRLIRTNLSEDQVRPVLPRLVDTIFNFIPSGLGSRGQIKLSPIELDKAVTDGLDWAVDKGYAWPEDPKTVEEEGCMEAADPSKVSSSARSRGAPQLGSLGSGNHFVEIERADRIFDEQVAQRLGIHKKGQILVLIHTGSRGYGHQICSDYLKVMERAIGKYNIQLPDRELAACPSKSPETEDYIPAMSAACNFAWINRQMITHWARQAFEKVFSKSPYSMDMRIVYDVCHNVAKFETHEINGEPTKVIVHRKGATRSFPPGHPDVPAQYRDVGQPVLIPGS